ncbi:hypothetical protein [Romboutsia sp. 1001713B170131_170501_G6]|uniref:hypothetical protein n=1 Tax=Romboutsia sp. 1001713B170131_170501_G6 TaxID=2787108 RepID=UPI0018AC0300|nr:hypothetical protein [Romboutsia sp. 1001713B170131_170501_G6]
MLYNINSNKSYINWNATDDERIIQNIINILNTVRYEVAYDRVMGRNPENLDRNFLDVQSLLISETYDLIEEYEPRAKIKNVFVKQLPNGEIDIEVVVDIE